MLQIPPPRPHRRRAIELGEGNVVEQRRETKLDASQRPAPCRQPLLPAYTPTSCEVEVCNRGRPSKAKKQFASPNGKHGDTAVPFPL